MNYCLIGKSNFQGCLIKNLRLDIKSFSETSCLIFKLLSCCKIPSISEITAWNNNENEKCDCRHNTEGLSHLMHYYPKHIIVTLTVKWATISLNTQPSSSQQGGQSGCKYTKVQTTPGVVRIYLLKTKIKAERRKTGFVWWMLVKLINSPYLTLLEVSKGAFRNFGGPWQVMTPGPSL